MRLHHEDRVRACIKTGLKPELDLSSEILDLATGFFTSGAPMSPGGGLDDYVVVVALALLSKACKQYRAIGEMVEMGLGEVADSNARMLFETMLASEYILRRRVILKREGKKVPVVKGKPLTTKFRTSLYLAKGAFDERKLARGLSGTPGLKREISAKARAEIEKDATERETEIGKEWPKRVKEAGYAGIKIKDLAESLGYGRLYASVYRITSSGVHASDATSHVRLDEGMDGDWRFLAAPGTDGIAKTLRLASLFLLKIVEVADARLGLGCKEKGDKLLGKVEGMRLEFPPS